MSRLLKTAAGHVRVSADGYALHVGKLTFSMALLNAMQEVGRRGELLMRKRTNFSVVGDPERPEVVLEEIKPTTLAMLLESILDHRVTTPVYYNLPDRVSVDVADIEAEFAKLGVEL